MQKFLVVCMNIFSSFRNRFFSRCHELCSFCNEHAKFWKYL